MSAYLNAYDYSYKSLRVCFEHLCKYSEAYITGVFKLIFRNTYIHYFRYDIMMLNFGAF